MNGAERRGFLALGSNLGDRAAQLADAVRRLRLVRGLDVTAVSSVYESEPWGFAEQGDFLNCVIAIRTTLAPEELIRRAKDIERDMGRTDAPRNHPRIIDIDLVLLDAVVLQSDVLTLPHPRMADRRFVLAPLCELAPDLRHPLRGETMLEMLATCPDMGRLRKTDIRI